MLTAITMSFAVVARISKRQVVILLVDLGAKGNAEHTA
jgi:hypothetical protein